MVTEQTERKPDEGAVSDFVERFAAQFVEAGVARMPSRVFAALIASESGVMTSAELSEQLKVSPAAVSGAVRYLAQVNMVSREREPGSRRERYRVANNQWYEALANRDQLLRAWEDTFRDGIAKLGADTGAGRRLAETLAFFEFLEGELAGMMERWRKLRAEQFGTGT
ncbi:GbsR/MarR family transcriptional regulator [Streptomyces formicae]